MRFRSQGQNLPIGLAQQAGSPILLESKSQQSSLVPRLPLARHRRHWSPQDECEFRGNPAGDSDLMSATVPI